jgi:hypothetical protein
MTELARSFRMDDGSFNSADPVIFEQFFKPAIRGGEEKLMLAVLQDAVKCFQENVLSQQPWEKKLFQEAEDWILAKNSDWFFHLKIFAKPYNWTPVIFVGACWCGSKQSASRTLLTIDEFVDAFVSAHTCMSKILE